MLIGKFSFTIYINALALTLSELVTYPVLYFVIDRMRRKVLNAGLFGSAMVLSGILVLVVVRQCVEP